MIWPSARLFGTVEIDPQRRQEARAPDHARFGPEVVDGNLEEALDLAGVEVHSDDVVTSGDLEHVGDELGRDGRPRLVLAVHAGVREARDDGRDPAGARRLAGRDQDQQFHQEVVRVVQGERGRL